MTWRHEAGSRSRSRLSLVLLLYFLGVIAVLTLAPFRFEVPERVRILYKGDWFDIIANVLLFVPLGFLFPLTLATEDEPSPLEVFLVGLVLSAAIETTQLFERERYTSVLDVLTNAAGAGIGAMVLRAVSQRIRVNANLVGRLALEIPLIGLIYLLLPLLLVSSMTAVAEPAELISLVPLGLVGARLMAAVQRNHFARVGLLDSRTMGMVAGGWTLLGAFPVLLRYPILGVAMVASVSVMTWYESSRPVPGEGPERRFEADALRRAAPYIAAYLLVMIVVPLGAGIGGWHFELGLTGSANDLTAQQVRLLEPVGALTVLGYLLAEARGRRELRFRSIAGRIALECGCVAALIEVSRAFQRGVGGSVVQFALTMAGGLLGAGIYHHQREHVRWILAHRSGAA